jgi:hypothetical protein
VGDRLHDDLHHLRPLDPFRSEAAMFRVLLYVVIAAVIVVLVALLVRAVT